MAANERDSCERPGGLAVWSNGGFEGQAGATLRDAVEPVGGRLLLSGSATASVLEAGAPDPLMQEAEVLFGQPDAGAAMACERVRWIHITSAGYTRYDREDFREFLRAKGVLFTNSSHVFDEPCAEHALGMLLSFARGLPQCVLEQAGDGAWRTWQMRPSMFLVRGQTVLIMGYGAIAKRLIELLSPFHVRVIVVRRGGRPADGVEVVAYEDLPRRLLDADHVFNILPDALATRGFCDADFFRAMRAGAHFYNLGRGTTVVQEDLVAALLLGHIEGAYLDVTDPEPLPPDSELRRVRNCHITQHTAGGHGDENERLAAYFTENLRRYRKGEPLDGIVGF